MPYCPMCGAENPENANHCLSCGSILTQVDRTQISIPEKKKTSKIRWVLYIFIAIIVLGAFGNIIQDEGENAESTSEPTVTYKWVKVWSGEYPHNILDFYYDNDLEVFEIPSDTVHLKVEIDFWDGDKDSYIRVKLYRWGEDDDYKVDSYYKNAKQGSGIMEKIDPKGTKYYINLDAVSGLEFKFTVYAKVPE